MCEFHCLLIVNDGILFGFWFHEHYLVALFYVGDSLALNF